MMQIEPRKETADLSTPLRSPGFSVELDGVDLLYAAFINESSTRCNVQRGAAENPGPVEMTILFRATNLSASVGMWRIEGDEQHLGQPLPIVPSPFPLSSRAKARDLQFRGPFVGMFFEERSVVERSAILFVPTRKANE
jgi:hypothetical protein